MDTKKAIIIGCDNIYIDDIQKAIVAAKLRGVEITTVAVGNELSKNEMFIKAIERSDLKLITLKPLPGTKRHKKPNHKRPYKYHR